MCVCVYTHVYIYIRSHIAMEHTATLSKEVCDTGKTFLLAHKPVV